MKLWVQPVRQMLFFFVGAVIGLGILAGSLYVGFRGKIFPNIAIGNVQVGGLNREQATEKVRNAVEEMSVTVSYGEYVWEMSGSELGVDVELSVGSALEIGRKISTLRDLTQGLSGNIEVDAVSDPGLSSFIASASAVIDVSAIPPSLSYENEGIVLEDGEDGTIIDGESFENSIRDIVATLNSSGLELPTKIVSFSLSEEEKSAVLLRSSALIRDKLILNVDRQYFTLRVSELVGFLETKSGSDSILSRERISEYVQGLADVVDRPARDARFQFEDGRVKEFTPDQYGLKIGIDASVLQIEKALAQLLGESEKESVTLVAERTPAKVKTSEVNDFGIVEVIGRGESYYRGSISSRVYNVELAARKLDGILISPGEEFSFNGAVGEISQATGFLSAYVISGGRTVLGDGGGVCQDSTTMFRAALDAGLPIIERWAHSYRVGYYEQNAKAGFDATVYAPNKDFRFRNDTPGYILIDTWYESGARHLVIDIYGSSDGRKSYVSQARVWGITPPPPALYQDDPSLPAGTVKQVDWAAWGAKSEFDYRVERGGEVIFSKTYYSSFRPWQDVFLRGTGE